MEHIENWGAESPVYIAPDEEIIRTGQDIEVINLGSPREPVNIEDLFGSDTASDTESYSSVVAESLGHWGSDLRIDEITLSEPQKKKEEATVPEPCAQCERTNLNEVKSVIPAGEPPPPYTAEETSAKQ
jgi:hypothetical protein